MSDQIYTGPSMMVPYSMDELIGQYHRHIKDACHHTGGVKSWVAFKEHFIMCCGASCDHAELLSRALMHWAINEQKKS